MKTINPGEVWPDDRGQHVQDHGGGIVKRGDTYYWFGEEPGTNQRARAAQRSRYSSTNLTQVDVSLWVLKASHLE